MLALDQDDVICSHGQFIHAISKKDHVVRDLARDDRFVETGLYGFGPVASDGKTLFWLNNPPDLSAHTESLERRTKAGGSVEVLAVIGRNGAHLRFDIDRGWLYTVSSSSASGVPVVGYSLATQELKELATDQMATFAITFDSDYIYWSVTEGFDTAGAIMRMKAPG